MAAKIGNRRLYNAIREYAKRMKVGYPEAIRLLASRVGYKDHTKIYAYVRGERQPKSANQYKIAREVHRAADYLFGE
jgi:hypothetical protein